MCVFVCICMCVSLCLFGCLWTSLTSLSILCFQFVEPLSLLYFSGHVHMPSEGSSPLKIIIISLASLKGEKPQPLKLSRTSTSSLQSGWLGGWRPLASHLPSLKTHLKQCLLCMTWQYAERFRLNPSHPDSDSDYFVRRASKRVVADLSGHLLKIWIANALDDIYNYSFIKLTITLTVWAHVVFMLMLRYAIREKTHFECTNNALWMFVNFDKHVHRHNW